MVDPYPIRLQVRRVRGFDLQRYSRATNGLFARVVDRRTVFGNPVRFGADGVATPRDAVRAFEAWVAGRSDERGDTRLQVLRRRLPELRGLNLACSCKPGAPCHGDVLIRLANPVCDYVTTPGPAPASEIERFYATHDTRFVLCAHDGTEMGSVAADRVATVAWNCWRERNGYYVKPIHTPKPL